MSRISWGIDGYGRRHYDCAYCGLYFGMVDHELINHECDLSKPRYHNRGVTQSPPNVDIFNNNAKVFDDLND